MGGVEAKCEGFDGWVDGKGSREGFNGWMDGWRKTRSMGYLMCRWMGGGEAKNGGLGGWLEGRGSRSY